MLPETTDVAAVLVRCHLQAQLVRNKFRMQESSDTIMTGTKCVELITVCHYAQQSTLQVVSSVPLHLETGWPYRAIIDYPDPKPTAVPG